jgi:hypothetical protein
MRERIRFGIVVALAFAGLWGVVPVLVAAPQETPIDVSPCDLVKDPPKYNQKLVRVRGNVGLAFENFSLYSTECLDADNDIWLEFGGDVEAPTVYCCDDHSREPQTSITVEGFEIRLLKDGVLYEFFRHLTAARETNPNGDECYGTECNLYAVTATLVGRFFSGGRWEREDGKVFYMGYGHLGCRSLLAIQAVQEFEATRTAIPEGDFVCSGETLLWEENDPGPVPDCEELDEEECVRERLVEEIRHSRGDTATLEMVRDWSEGTLPVGFCGTSHSRWSSPDRLLTYKVELRCYCERKLRWDDCGNKTWKPYKLVREVCRPAR